MKNEIATLLTPQTWNVLREQGAVLVKSGFLPGTINTPEKAIAVMMKGYEVGFPPMQAFSHIHIIQAKPCISAEAQLALIYKNCPGAIINFIKLEDNGCIIEASRPGGKITKFEFDEEDAKKAGLLTKEMWKKYPRAMYRSRCVSEMARTMFPDSIMGLSYTPEEIDPDIVLNEDGEVLEVKAIDAPKEEESKQAPKPIEIFNLKEHAEKVRSYIVKYREAKKLPEFHKEEFDLIFEMMEDKPNTKESIHEVLQMIASIILPPELERTTGISSEMEI